MANVVKSVGYGVGKLHTGLIRYLCELWNEGARGEVEPFFERLGISLHNVERLRPTVEEKGVDLLIRAEIKDSDSLDNLAMVEMKVDDHENRIKRRTLEKDYQTEIYPKLLPGFSTHLFVTLGVGEHYAPPHNDCFNWVKLSDFAEAVAAVNRPNMIIRDWLKMLQEELEVRQKAGAATESPVHHSSMRTGIWNLYLLGSIKERLKKQQELTAHTCKAKAYFYGARPDTILHFGGTIPFFAEINYRGQLNLKIDVLRSGSMVKQRSVSPAQQYLLQHCHDLDPRLHSTKLGKNTKKTKTVMSFDVGLLPSGGLHFAKSPDATCDRITQILSRFYAMPVEGNL